MTLKSKAVLSGSRQLLRSHSSENLPTSQSQLNVQMMSHTLTIREVMTLNLTFNLGNEGLVFIANIFSNNLNF